MGLAWPVPIALGIALVWPTSLLHAEPELPPDYRLLRKDELQKLLPGNTLTNDKLGACDLLFRDDGALVFKGTMPENMRDCAKARGQWQITGDQFCVNVEGEQDGEKRREQACLHVATNGENYLTPPSSFKAQFYWPTVEFVVAARSTPPFDELTANPFVYVGKRVAYEVNFLTMKTATKGIFAFRAAESPRIVVDDIPSGKLRKPGWVKIIAKVMGNIELDGTPVPMLSYIDVR